MPRLLKSSRLCRWLTVCFLLACMVGNKMYAQADSYIYDYQFTTGVDTSQWIDCDTWDNATFYGYSSISNYDIGFDFDFFGQSIRLINVSYFGSVYLESEYFNEHFNYPSFSPQNLVNAPLLRPLGLSQSMISIAYRRCKLLGVADSHLFVLDYVMGSSSSPSRRMQVQLREWDNSVTFLYGEMTDGIQYDMQIGIAGTPTKYIVVDQLTHTATDEALNDNQVRGWPGQGRYYKFTPVCTPPPRLFFETLTSNSVRVSWSDVGRYRVEYGEEGFVPGMGTSVDVVGNELILDSLDDTLVYDVYVRRFCPDSSLGEPALARYYMRYCASNDWIGNRIHYWDLNASGVTCRRGIRTHPDADVGCFDLGPSSSQSRHTVHSNPTELDSITGYALLKVPPGYCYSVRLGNWRDGAEQESVEYTLSVDTNDYDLLILNYAIVEQQPNHRPEQQPYFTFSILDSAGRLIDNCYYANFISGDSSGWQRVTNNYVIVWRDWSAVGVDLTSLHGRTIRVKLSNADCSLGAHFGYAYFTLESGRKNLRMMACGASEDNVLYAPKGFTYRWYRADNPSETLSTDDSLYVTEDGYYRCDATYRLSSLNCGFTVSAYAGVRYPAAAFSMDYLDSCGMHIRFVNESFVAHDSAHTLTSTEPCEQYLWVFDDSITTTLINPVREFDTGTHTVTLYAMLGNGECVDSVSRTFRVTRVYDTIYATVCSGTPYYLQDTVFLDSGTYHYEDYCGSFLLHLAYFDTAFYSVYDTICQGRTVNFFDSTYSTSGIYSHQWATDGCDTVASLHLHVIPTIESQSADTFLLGTTYHFGMEDYSLPGVYSQMLSTIEGCDSVCRLRLSSIEFHDTTVCVDAMPLNWRGDLFAQGGTDTLNLRCVAGTDSIVVLGVSVRQHPVAQLVAEPFCEEGGYYLVGLSDTLVYRWTAQPTDIQLPTGLILGSQYPDGLRLEPAESTVYSVIIDYSDEPKCPLSDTLMIESVPVVNAQLHVSPSWLWGDNPELTATDMGDTSWWREWYVNGILQSEEGTTLVYRADVGDDSLQVMLVNYSELCSDTAYATVGVSRQELWFPNVFTPDEATNNVFRGYGVNIVQYDLQIYTQWGNRIFHTKNMEEVWDGTYNGVRSPVSAYVYKCTYATLEGEKKIVVGTVVLLR